MTVNEKREKMIKQIVNSDDEGINALYTKLMESKPAHKNITKKDLIRTMAKVTAEVLNDFDLTDCLELVLVFSTVCDETCKILFKEDK